MRLRNLLLLMTALLLGMVLYGFTGAWQTPQMVRYTVALPDWPAGQPPLRIVQLSDIHGNWINMPPSRIAGIVRQVNAERPDMVVLTGDFSGGQLIDWPPIRLENFTDPLGGFQSRYGTYAVVGNHDTRTWMRWAFRRTHVRLLIDQWLEIGPVVLAGANDVTNVDNPAVSVAALERQLPMGKPVILLAHEPDYFQYLPANVDLLIAGHTHGGQIKLPLLGTKDLGPFLNAHLRGSFFEHRQAMVVSSGLGTSIVPIRIGVRPEIVVITVQGRGSGAATAPPAGQTAGLHQ